MLLEVFKGLNGCHLNSVVYWQNLCVYNVHCVHQKNSKYPKSDDMLTFLFYKEGRHVVGFWDWWFSLVKQDVHSWLDRLILCVVHGFTVQTCVFFIKDLDGLKTDALYLGVLLFSCRIHFGLVQILSSCRKTRLWMMQPLENIF